MDNRYGTIYVNNQYWDSSLTGSSHLADTHERFKQRVRPSRMTLEEAEVAEKMANPWLIGADPEFVCLQGGTIKAIHDVLPHEGEIGYDHGGYVVEVRPKPSKGAFMLVKRIRDVLVGEKAKAIGKYKWRAGAMVKAVRGNGGNPFHGGQPLGGHVHFDFPPPVNEVVGLDREEADTDFKGILAAQDKVAQMLERLEILPPAECQARRETEYGKFGNWRISNDKRHVEYRSYPSWLFHPHTAFLTLTMAKLAAVQPDLAREMLKAPSYKKLVSFIDCFRFKDANARRVSERMLEGKDVKFLQHDPDGDMRETWKNIGL